MLSPFIPVHFPFNQLTIVLLLMDPDNRNRSFAQLLGRLQGTDPLVGQDREAVRLFPDYRVRRSEFQLPGPDRIRDEEIESVDEFLDRGNMDPWGHGHPWPIFLDDKVGLASLGWSRWPYEVVELGAGGFGVVHLAFKMQDVDQTPFKRRFAAVKVQKMTEHDIKQLWKEVSILKSVKHRNIIDYYGAFVDSGEQRPIPVGKEFGPLDARARHKKFMDRWESNVNLNGYPSSTDSESSSDGEWMHSSHASSGSSSGSDQKRGAKRKHGGSNWVAERQPRKSSHSSSDSGSDQERGSKQKHGVSNWVAARQLRKSSHSSEVFRTQPASGSESSGVPKQPDFGYFCMVMEYATAGDLEREIRRYPNLYIPESGALYYAKQILSGLQYIHLKGIIHNDLHCGNIFLSYNRDTSKRCMLGDFGRASIRGDHDFANVTYERRLEEDIGDVALIIEMMLLGDVDDEVFAPLSEPHISPAARQVIASHATTVPELLSLIWFHGFPLAPGKGKDRTPHRNIREPPEPLPPPMPAKTSVPRRLMHPATGKSDVQAHWPHGVQITPKNRTTVSWVRHAAPAPVAPAPRIETSSPNQVVHHVDFADPQPGPSGVSPAHVSRTRERSVSMRPMTRYQNQSASRVRHAPSAAAGAPPLRGETSQPNPVVYRVDFANPQPGPSGVSAPPRHQSVPQSRQVTGKGAPRSRSGSPDTRSPQ